MKDDFWGGEGGSSICSFVNNWFCYDEGRIVGTSALSFYNSISAPSAPEGACYDGSDIKLLLPMWIDIVVMLVFHFLFLVISISIVHFSLYLGLITWLYVPYLWAFQFINSCSLIRSRHFGLGSCFGTMYFDLFTGWRSV